MLFCVEKFNCCYKCQIDNCFLNMAITGIVGIWVKEIGPQYSLPVGNGE